jgi:Fur family ferric uptake transcriptional regulator/Fur family peroxide stress response transcriptional regulator
MPKTPNDSTDDLAALLRERGHRVTSQRLVILRELRRAGRHVTAHEVQEAVRDQLPGTSTPTVYATLDLLVEFGLARKLWSAGPTALYDARATPHQHVVCRRCGRVQDIDIEIEPAAALAAARAAGFDPDGAELIIPGYCAECASAGARADAVA